MTDAARDLYLFVAVLGLLPAVSLAGFPALAQSAFVAVGAVGALKLEDQGLPIGGAAVLATALGALAGALTGLLVARAAPAFIALSTWALAWLGYVTLLGFPSLSGGAEGLTRPLFDRVEAPFGLAFDLTSQVHLVAAAILSVAAYLVYLRVRAGALGSDALAIRDDQELAASLNVPITARTATLFALSGAGAAAAGAGIAILLGVAAPEDMAPLLALQLLAAAVAGGRHPLLGLVVIVVLQRAPDLVTPFVLLAAVALRTQPRPYADRIERVDPPPLEPTHEALQVRDLHVTLEGREILKGLDLDVEPGEIHALVGANGSGKTTALNALKIPHSFQRAAGFESLTPYRQVLLVLRANYQDPRAFTYLDLVGLEPGQTDLTAGEQRLLAVARTAATQAPVLAFDEPSVGMTASERERLAEALKALARAGRAILVVEHDQRFIQGLADRTTRLR